MYDDFDIMSANALNYEPHDKFYGDNISISKYNIQQFMLI